MCSGTLPPSLVPDINDKDQSESRSTLNPEEEGGKNNHRSDGERERERKGKESVGKKRQWGKHIYWHPWAVTTLIYGGWNPCLVRKVLLGWRESPGADLELIAFDLNKLSDLRERALLRAATATGPERRGKSEKVWNVENTERRFTSITFDLWPPGRTPLVVLYIIHKQ